MGEKTVQKLIRLTVEENEELKRKAASVGLTEAALIRSLIAGLKPKEKPDERFFDVITELSDISNEIIQLIACARSGGLNTTDLEQALIRWGEFQTKVMNEFLCPDESELWQ